MFTRMYKKNGALIYIISVCGDGVEKARDEIKRIDASVESYLEAYEEYVADGPLILKV